MGCFENFITVPKYESIKHVLSVAFLFFYVCICVGVQGYHATVPEPHKRTSGTCIMCTYLILCDGLGDVCRGGGGGDIRFGIKRSVDRFRGLDYRSVDRIGLK